MKKITALILSVIMILTLMPTVMLAAEEAVPGNSSRAVPENAIAQVTMNGGEPVYCNNADEINEAVANTTAADNCVVQMLKDLTIDEWLIKDGYFELQLNEKTINGAINIGDPYGGGNKPVNLTISGDGTITYDNYIPISVNGEGTLVLTIKGGNVFSNNAPAIQVNRDTVELNIYGGEFAGNPYVLHYGAARSINIYGGSFPNGFTTGGNSITLEEVLPDGYAFYDENNNEVTNLAGNSTGTTLVTVKKKASPPHTHNWGSWVDNGDGTHTRTCGNAGCDIGTETEEHSWGEWKVVYEEHRRNCEDCNAEQKEGHGYTWKHDETSHWRECTTEGCSYKKSEAHRYDNGVIKTAPTCTTQGEKVFTCKQIDCRHQKSEAIPALGGHKLSAWKDSKDGENHIKSCENNGCTYTEAQNHTWDNGKITIYPTYTKEGEKTFTCTVCSAIKTEKIPATKPIEIIGGGTTESDPERDFWYEVRKEVEASDKGSTITINAEDYNSLPWYVMDAARANGVGLKIEWDGKTIKIPAGKALNEKYRTAYPFEYLAKYNFDKMMAEEIPAVPETGAPVNAVILVAFTLAIAGAGTAIILKRKIK